MFILGAAVGAFVAVVLILFGFGLLISAAWGEYLEIGEEADE